MSDRTDNLAKELLALKGEDGLINVAKAEQWAKRGASMIGLSPLHALFPHDPARASPYSPSSRLALNVLYVDVEAIDEARTCDAAREFWSTRSLRRTDS